MKGKKKKKRKEKKRREKKRKKLSSAHELFSLCSPPGQALDLPTKKKKQRKPTRVGKDFHGQNPISGLFPHPPTTNLFPLLKLEGPASATLPPPSSPVHLSSSISILASFWMLTLFWVLLAFFFWGGINQVMIM